MAVHKSDFSKVAVHGKWPSIGLLDARLAKSLYADNMNIKILGNFKGKAISHEKRKVERKGLHETRKKGLS